MDSIGASGVKMGVVDYILTLPEYRAEYQVFGRTTLVTGNNELFTEYIADSLLKPPKRFRPGV